MIVNANKTTIRLSNPETVAIYLLSKEKGITPQELVSDLVKKSPDNKTMASYIREYLTLNLIRRTLQWK